MRHYARDVLFCLLQILIYLVNTILQQQSGRTCLPLLRNIMVFGDCPPYLHRRNSSYILNAKWFHPAVRNGINMCMAFLTQIYSQTWLLAPVLSNIEAEQIKRKERKKRGSERNPC